MPASISHNCFYIHADPSNRSCVSATRLESMQVSSDSGRCIQDLAPALFGDAIRASGNDAPSHLVEKLPAQRTGESVNATFCDPLAPMTTPAWYVLVYHRTAVGLLLAVDGLDCSQMLHRIVQQGRLESAQWQTGASGRFPALLNDAVAAARRSCSGPLWSPANGRGRHVIGVTTMSRCEHDAHEERSPCAGLAILPRRNTKWTT